MRNCSCPNCGAGLSFADDREFGFCEYCGAKVDLVDYRTSTTQRIVDEARIKEAEYDHEFRLKELESEGKEEKRFRFLDIVGYGIALAMILAGEFLPNKSTLTLLGMLVAMGVTFFMIISHQNSQTKKEARTKEATARREKSLGKVKVPEAVMDYQFKNYKILESAFVAAGYKNVKVINLNDMAVNLGPRAGKTASVTVNGTAAVAGGWYYPDDRVVITYHGGPVLF